jgi:hypothetical protein
VQFRPPSSSFEGNSSYSNTSSPPSLITMHTIVMGHGWHVWNPQRPPIAIQRKITPFSWMISSGSLTIGVICNKCVIFNCSYLSWHGKVCSNIWKGYL